MNEFLQYRHEAKQLVLSETVPTVIHTIRYTAVFDQLRYNTDICNAAIIF